MTGGSVDVRKEGRKGPAGRHRGKLAEGRVLGGGGRDDGCHVDRGGDRGGRRGRGRAVLHQGHAGGRRNSECEKKKVEKKGAEKIAKVEKN